MNERNAVRFIRLPEVRQITGLGKTTLYGMLKAGEFPPPVKIGERAVAWVATEIERWANDRIAARPVPVRNTLTLVA